MQETLTDAQIRQMAPLTLAYIGDAVYELHVRLYLLGQKSESSHNLHMKSVKYVSAAAQATAARRIMDVLTEEELYYFKRGRNTHTPTVPKNADVTAYRVATGFETVIGYLYLTGQSARIAELFTIITPAAEENGQKKQLAESPGGVL